LTDDLSILFADPPEAPAAPEPLIVDRSTVERYATCPAQGAYVDAGAVNTCSPEAESGSEVHRILAVAVKARSMDGMRANGLRDLIEQMAMASSPDLQPDVIEALKRSYSIVQLICEHPKTGEQRNPDDLIRFDGGEGAHRGQISGDMDVDGTVVRLTCEIDLLMATASEAALSAWDWKSGHRWWTATDVRFSFQFQFYAYLILRTYPSVETVEFSVFMTREGVGTDPATFRRKDMFSIGERIKSAVRLLLQHRSADPSTVPAWPAPEKCSTCPAVKLCARRHTDAIDDPEQALKSLIVLDAAADRYRSQLTAIVRQRGDLVYQDVAYGQCAPLERAPRAKPCKIYKPEVNMGGNGRGEVPQREDGALAGDLRRGAGSAGDGQIVPDGSGSLRGNIRDQASELRRLVAAGEAIQRDVEVPAITAEQEREVNRICPLEWPEFLSAWQAMLGASISGGDFIAGIVKLVKRVGKAGRESSITKQTRKQWVVASLAGTLNWLEGKI
jgi:hypothetical protein